MAVNYFIFGGTRTDGTDGINFATAFKCYPSGTYAYGSGEVDYDTQSICGLTGDILIPKNRFENTTLVYPCIMVTKDNTEFNKYIKAIKQAYLRYSQLGKYLILRDSYTTNGYRRAFLKSIDIEEIQLTAAKIGFNFEVDPRFFLDSGSDVIDIGFTKNRPNNPYPITNPTRDLVTNAYQTSNVFGTISKPIIRITLGSSMGTGKELAVEFTDINNQSVSNIIKVKKGNGSSRIIDIDTETMKVYNINTYANESASISSGFIQEMALSPSITYCRAYIIDPNSQTAYSDCNVKVIPRWYTL